MKSVIYVKKTYVASGEGLAGAHLSKKTSLSPLCLLFTATSILVIAPSYGEMDTPEEENIEESEVEPWA